MSSRLIALPMPAAASATLSPGRTRLLAFRGVWPAGLTLLFAAITAATWQRWTDQAFPIDLGREMQVPRMIVQGKLLYRDIRCFYGPLGYWINAGLVAVFGEHQSVLWYANVARFTATMALLWLIARRLLGPAIAALALGSYVYAWFFTLVVPYSAAHGWGTLLLVAGTACMARQLTRKPTGEFSEPRGIGWSIAAAGLFSLALATKHEITLCAAAMLAILVVDLAWRQPAGPIRRTAAVLTALAALVPVTLIALFVLRSVPLSVVLGDNIWMPEMWAYYGGASGYAYDTALGTWKLTLLIEWMGLLAGMVATLGLLARSQRQGKADALWLTLLSSVIVVVVAQAYQALSGAVGRDVVNYPKPRLREIVETLSLLCLPLSLMALGGLAWVSVQRGRKGRSIRLTWQRLGPRNQLGIVCLVGYLSFATREIPTGLGLIRGPFAPLAAAWLLTLVLPRGLRWRYGVRRVWTAGVGLALAAGTVCGIDNLMFLQTRPSTFVQGELGSMYAWQRRKPYEPTWFHDAVDIINRNRTRIADQSIVCAPEGGWLHALLDLDWPTRDIPWVNFCSRWILEDLDREPPRFILVMEPNLMTGDFPEVNRLIHERYVPIDTNASGMTLYELPAVTEHLTYDGPTDGGREAATQQGVKP